jgi:AhpD family alkylhydroperoxidase
VLPARLRELTVFRVATLVNCSWCVDFGTTLQHLDGLDVERVQHIDEYPTHRTHPLYEPVERAPTPTPTR